MDPRAGYVSVMRKLRWVAKRTGTLEALERPGNRFLWHLRTMFAIYDAEDLASLDLPWWTYQVIRLVERFLSERDAPRVFEFGSGASTVWLARRGARVHSVEHDPDFAAIVRRLLGDTTDVELSVVPPTRPSGVPSVRSLRRGYEHLDFSDYVATVEQVDGPFDLVIIDGRARVECLRRVLPHLSSDGIVVFDDVNRRRYRAALNVPGFDTQVYRGATPCVLYPNSTAVIRRTGA